MKMANPRLFVLPLIFLASCSGTWQQDNETTFRKACLDDAKTWASPGNATTYCNCVIAKVKAKYPDQDEAMKHIDMLSGDKDLQACKDSLMKK